MASRGQVGPGAGSGEDELDSESASESESSGPDGPAEEDEFDSESGSVSDASRRDGLASQGGDSEATDGGAGGGGSHGSYGPEPQEELAAPETDLVLAGSEMPSFADEGGNLEEDDVPSGAASVPAGHGGSISADDAGDREEFAVPEADSALASPETPTFVDEVGNLEEDDAAPADNRGPISADDAGDREDIAAPVPEADSVLASPETPTFVDEVGNLEEDDAAPPGNIMPISADDAGDREDIAAPGASSVRSAFGVPISANDAGSPEDRRAPISGIDSDLHLATNLHAILGDVQAEVVENDGMVAYDAPNNGLLRRRGAASMDDPGVSAAVVRTVLETIGRYHGDPAAPAVVVLSVVFAAVARCNVEHALDPSTLLCGHGDLEVAALGSAPAAATEKGHLFDSRVAAVELPTVGDPASQGPVAHDAGLPNRWPELEAETASPRADVEEQGAVGAAEAGNAKQKDAGVDAILEEEEQEEVNGGGQTDSADPLVDSLADPDAAVAAAFAGYSPQQLRQLVEELEGREDQEVVDERMRARARAAARRRADAGVDPFLALLRERGGGNITIAWRRFFDTDGDGELSFAEFCQALTDLGYRDIDLLTLWKDLTARGNSPAGDSITLEALDPEGAMILEVFSGWCIREHGGPWEVFKKLDDDGSDSLTAEEFADGLEELGFFELPNLPTAIADRGLALSNLFPLLDANGCGCVTAEKLLFLEADKNKRAWIQKELQEQRETGCIDRDLEPLTNVAQDLLHGMVMRHTNMGGRHWTRSRSEVAIGGPWGKFEFPHGSQPTPGSPRERPMPAYMRRKQALDADPGARKPTRSKSNSGHTLSPHVLDHYRGWGLGGGKITFAAKGTESAKAAPQPTPLRSASLGALPNHKGPGGIANDSSFARRRKCYRQSMVPPMLPAIGPPVATTSNNIGRRRPSLGHRGGGPHGAGAAFDPRVCQHFVASKSQRALFEFYA